MLVWRGRPRPRVVQHRKDVVEDLAISTDSDPADSGHALATPELLAW